MAKGRRKGFRNLLRSIGRGANKLGKSRIGRSIRRTGRRSLNQLVNTGSRTARKAIRAGTNNLLGMAGAMGASVAPYPDKNVRKARKRRKGRRGRQNTTMPVVF